MKRLLEDSSYVHLLERRPTISLSTNAPLQRAKPDAVDHVYVLLHLLFQAEEPVQPEDSSRTQNPVNVKQYEVKERVRNPVTQNVHGMNNIQRVIEEGKSLRDSNEERHHPSGRDKAIERPVKVHGRRHHRHSFLLHANCKGPRPPADIKSDSDTAERFQFEDMVNGEVNGIVGGNDPPGFLPSLEVKTVFAVVKGFLVLAVDQASEVFARVGSPDDRVIVGDGPEAKGEREGFWKGRGRCRMAAAAGKRLAAFEKEPLRQEFVIRAGTVNRIGHVAEELVGEEMAWGAHWS